MGWAALSYSLGMALGNSFPISIALYGVCLEKFVCYNKQGMLNCGVWAASVIRGSYYIRIGK